MTMCRQLVFMVLVLCLLVSGGCGTGRAPVLAEKTFVSVLIGSEPAGASLYLNDKLVGTTPYRLERTAEGYEAAYFIAQTMSEMVFLREGYHRTTKIITRKNCYEELHLEVQLDPSPGVLEHRGHIMVFLDEKEGAVPKDVAYGSLTIKSSPERAEIFLNDNMVAMTPSVGLQLEAGPYNLRLILDGYEVWERNIEIIAENEIIMTALLEKTW